MVGIVDFPSLWLQGPRAAAKMRLHWDGNNDSVEERNRSAAFGTGAVPTLIDQGDRCASSPIGCARTRTSRRNTRFRSIRRSRRAARRCMANTAPNAMARAGAISRAPGRQVEPIARIRTDPCRLDNYTHALAAEQGNLYAAYPDERFSHFRKTDGYANLPLDGIWLRAPYLHNGSVPTVRDLLEPAENRPKVFYRGYDVIDQRRLGFVSDVAEEGGAQILPLRDPVRRRSGRNAPAKRTPRTATTTMSACRANGPATAIAVMTGPLTGPSCRRRTRTRSSNI